MINDQASRRVRARRSSGESMTGVLLRALTITALLSLPGIAATAVAAPLDPATLTKYVDALPIPVPMAKAGRDFYEIGAYPVEQLLHRDLPAKTRLYGYGPTQATATYPGMTIEAVRGVPLRVHWTNHLPLPHLFANAFDPTIGHPDVTTGVPITPHVHGGEQEPGSDGGPFTWFTPGFAEKGRDWKYETYTYANRQQAATIWYHDHAYGYTRFNPYAGLAGFYIIRDPSREWPFLPRGKYEIPIVIQDKMFTDDGQLFYPVADEPNPEHPIWIPEFFGDVMLANGKIWPYLNVEQHRYRFRLLNGSQARFYSLALAVRNTGAPGPAFVQIATDGGYLGRPVTLNDPLNPASPRLLIAPGERADVVIDFNRLPVGTELLLTNTANGPYPDGDPVEPGTTGQIMLFRVGPRTRPDFSSVPRILNLFAPRLTNPTVTRQLTLNEVQGENGPLAMYLNGMELMSPATEKPALGTTEQWDIVNLTMDAHPIHLHLVQFQILNRQKFDPSYYAAYDAANPVLPTMDPVTVPIGPYLTGPPIAPDLNERGWKDTYRMNPGEVTRVLIKFAPQDNAFGRNFEFDATAAPGYVWHCHILEHEENDMMRPLLMVAPTLAQAAALDAAAGADANASDAVPNLESAAQLPATPMLLAASPNPAKGSMLLRFALPATAEVDLRVYDVQGHQVRVLASGAFGAGEHQVQWTASDDAGRQMSAGVYFSRMQAAGVTRTQKLLLIP